jgi:hypothetical protein
MAGKSAPKKPVSDYARPTAKPVAAKPKPDTPAEPVNVGATHQGEAPGPPEPTEEELRELNVTYPLPAPPDLNDQGPSHEQTLQALADSEYRNRVLEAKLAELSAE